MSYVKKESNGDIICKADDTFNLLKKGDYVYYYNGKEKIHKCIDDNFYHEYNSLESSSPLYVKEININEWVVENIYGFKHMNNIPDVGERVIKVEKNYNGNEYMITFESKKRAIIKCDSGYALILNSELDIKRDDSHRYYKYQDKNLDELQKEWKRRLENNDEFVEYIGKKYLVKIRKNKIGSILDDETTDEESNN